MEATHAVNQRETKLMCVCVSVCVCVCLSYARKQVSLPALKLHLYPVSNRYADTSHANPKDRNAKVGLCANRT